MDIVCEGRLVFKSISIEESLAVSRAVDAILSRRSTGLQDGDDALVIGELKTRVNCDPPYLLPHVSIKPNGALGNRVRSWMKPRVSQDEQRELCPEVNATFVERARSGGQRQHEATSRTA